MIVPAPRTLCGFVAIGGRWGLNYRRLSRANREDNWSRFIARIGPFLFSWSWAKDGDDD